MATKEKVGTIDEIITRWGFDNKKKEIRSNLAELNIRDITKEYFTKKGTKRTSYTVKIYPSYEAKRGDMIGHEDAVRAALGLDNLTRAIRNENYDSLTGTHLALSAYHNASMDIEKAASLVFDDIQDIFAKIDPFTSGVIQNTADRGRFAQDIADYAKAKASEEVSNARNVYPIARQELSGYEKERRGITLQRRGLKSEIEGIEAYLKGIESHFEEIRVYLEEEDPTAKGYGAILNEYAKDVDEKHDNSEKIKTLIEWDKKLKNYKNGELKRIIEEAKGEFDSRKKELDQKRLDHLEKALAYATIASQPEVVERMYQSSPKDSVTNNSKITTPLVAVKEQTTGAEEAKKVMDNNTVRYRQ